MKDERQHERQDERRGRCEDKTKEKTREDQEIYDMLCVWLCVFLKITRPSNNFDFSKLPLPTLKEFNFPGNFVFVRLQIKIIFELFR